MPRWPDSSRPLCRGHSSRTGEPCGNYPNHGLTVCEAHGGAPKHARKAGERRMAERKAKDYAASLVAAAHVDADPLEYLLDSLHRAGCMTASYGLLVLGLEGSALEAGTGLLTYDRAGFFRMHPFVASYEKALERQAELAKIAIDAGVKERQVRIEAAKMQALVQLFGAVISDPALGLDAERRGVALQIAARAIREAPGEEE